MGSIQSKTMRHTKKENIHNEEKKLTNQNQPRNDTDK